jgi:predicted restriction endonuclease
MPATAVDKMRKAKEGRTLPSAHRLHISTGAQRRTLTDEGRARLRERRHSAETRQKIADSQSGEKSAAWKGGRSTPIQIARAHLKYWRKQVLARDGHRCQREGCGATESRGKRKGLHAHHIKSFIGFPELRYEVSNGITLCLDHHIEADRQARLAQAKAA